MHDHSHCHGILNGTGLLDGCATYILLLTDSYATCMSFPRNVKVVCHPPIYTSVVPSTRDEYD